jgi:hypothetical protein
MSLAEHFLNVFVDIRHFTLIFDTAGTGATRNRRRKRRSLAHWACSVRLRSAIMAAKMARFNPDVRRESLMRGDEQILDHVITRESISRELFHVAFGKLDTGINGE